MLKIKKTDKSMLLILSNLLNCFCTFINVDHVITYYFCTEYNFRSNIILKDLALPKSFGGLSSFQI